MLRRAAAGKPTSPPRTRPREAMIVVSTALAISFGLMLWALCKAIVEGMRGQHTNWVAWSGGYCMSILSFPYLLVYPNHDHAFAYILPWPGE